MTLSARRLLTLVCLALPLAPACRHESAPPPPPPPPEVRVITLAPARVGLTTDWVATLDGDVNAQIRPQVSGYLIKRDYEEGSEVRKGQVLFEIDPRSFEAALAQAQAALGQAQAQQGKTDRDLKRDQPLADQHAIAQSQLDNDVQANLAAVAGIKSAQAAVDAAELNLGFTKVTSLIDGVAAIATAQIGDLVSPPTLLTTVSQVDPIKAYFPISEREYLQFAGRINHRAGETPFEPGAGLTLVLADGSVYPHAGSFLAADRAIDAKTGTIRISATFPNPDRELRPGQFGHVRAETSVRPNALLVPQRAVTELQGLYQVRIVGPDNKVTTRSVTPGDRLDTRWIIDKGLEPGDRVIVEGPATKDGTVVVPTPYTAAPEPH